jgi:hypothetical protein
MRVHAISEDRPYLRQQFYSNQSVTSTFSLTAALLMNDVVQAKTVILNTKEIL